MTDHEKTKDELIDELATLRNRIGSIEEERLQYEKMEYELQVKTFELDLRLKELYCLLDISKLVDDSSASLADLIKNIVDVIPSGWQYPEITYCRVLVEGEEYKTENYRSTEWKEQYALFYDSFEIGLLEVGYLEDTPIIDGGYFLDEEKSMLKALGEQFERIIHRKKTEEQLQYYATVDTMTGVLNRRTGLTLLEKQMKLMQRNKSSLSICFIDADNLKQVNDTFGHEEGDDLIIIITDIMRSSVRRSDTLCRLGGDEFLIILADCKERQAEEIFSIIVDKISAFNGQKAKPYSLSLSHGCAEYNWKDDLLPDALISLADERMYKEKQEKKKHLST